MACNRLLQMITWTMYNNFFSLDNIGIVYFFKRLSQVEFLTNRLKLIYLAQNFSSAIAFPLRWIRNNPWQLLCGLNLLLWLLPLDLGGLVRRVFTHGGLVSDTPEYIHVYSIVRETCCIWCGTLNSRSELYKGVSAPNNRRHTVWLSAEGVKVWYDFKPCSTNRCWRTHATTPLPSKLVGIISILWDKLLQMKIHICAFLTYLQQQKRNKS